MESAAAHGCDAAARERAADGRGYEAIVRATQPECTVRPLAPRMHTPALVERQHVPVGASERGYTRAAPHRHLPRLGRVVASPAPQAAAAAAPPREQATLAAHRRRMLRAAAHGALRHERGRR